MTPSECPACQSSRTTQTVRVRRDDGLELGGWACWCCGYSWESINGYPCRDDVQEAHRYRQTERYARLTRKYGHELDG